jgi:hypothetical protein
MLTSLDSFKDGDNITVIIRDIMFKADSESDFADLGKQFLVNAKRKLTIKIFDLKKTLEQL